MAGLLIASLTSLTLASGCDSSRVTTCGDGGGAFSASINGSRTILLLSCAGTVRTPPESVTVQPGDSITIRWPELTAIRATGTALQVHGLHGKAVHSGTADIYLVKVGAPCQNAHRTCPVLEVKVK